MNANNFNRRRGLAFVPALILFVIVMVFAATALMMLARVAKKALGPPPYNGPTTNTPPDAVFYLPYDGFTPVGAGAAAAMSPMWRQLVANNNVTASTADAFIDIMGDPEAEFEIVVLRSFDLVNWVEIIRTNTIDKQVVWYDPLPDTNTAVFYRPLVVLP